MTLLVSSTYRNPTEPPGARSGCALVTLAFCVCSGHTLDTLDSEAPSVGVLIFTDSCLFAIRQETRLTRNAILAPSLCLCRGPREIWSLPDRYQR
jgi:hypothetical protein